MAVAAAIVMSVLAGGTTTTASADIPAAPAPTITALSVATGWDKLPTTTQLSGTGLGQVTRVLIGDVPAAITSAGPTTLWLKIPARSAGTFPVTVILADSQTRLTNPRLTFTVKGFNAEVLRLTNAARAKTRKCGKTTYKKTFALKANTLLDRSALGHSTDMATRGYFSHTGKGKTDPGDRIRKAGFKPKHWGENIAAGYRTPESVVTAWIASPGHCKILMSPKYKYLGVGYAYGPTALYGSYWTQDFAS